MIPIFMCGNRNTTDGILLCALSIAKTTRREIKLFVGTMNLTDINPEFKELRECDLKSAEEVLKKANPNSSVTIINLEENFRRELINSKNIKTAYTPYAMIRLFADECAVLPDKLIYLDTDVLLAKDIGLFYDIDINDYDLAGSLDYYGKVFINPRYLNSGVMLWNLKRIRENGIFRRAVTMCNNRKMLLMDQSAINKCARRKLILPSKFNEQHKKKKDTVIQHFSMRIRWFPFIKTEKIKPWNFELLHKKLKLFDYDDIIEEFKLIKQGECARE